VQEGNSYPRWMARLFVELVVLEAEAARQRMLAQWIGLGGDPQSLPWERV